MGESVLLKNYPLLSYKAAKWITTLRLKGLGVDMISVDEVDSAALPIHNILLVHDTIAIENLTNLQLLPSSDFMFSCFPLKIKNADGSPVRAAAFIKEETEDKRD